MGKTDVKKYKVQVKQTGMWMTLFNESLYTSCKEVEAYSFTHEMLRKYGIIQPSGDLYSKRDSINLYESVQTGESGYIFILKDEKLGRVFVQDLTEDGKGCYTTKNISCATVYHKKEDWNRVCNCLSLISGFSKIEGHAAIAVTEDLIPVYSTESKEDEERGLIDQTYESVRKRRVTVSQDSTFFEVC